MYPYQDSTRPIEERIDDLLARMTTEEKIMQTDLYSNSDFCTVDKNGRVTEIDFDKIDLLFRAMAEAEEEAVLNSMLTAQTVTGFDGTTKRSLSEFIGQIFA